MNDAAHGLPTATFGAMEMAELYAALRAAGYDDPVLRGHGDAAHDGGARVPASVAMQSFEAAERALAAPLIGLDAGAKVRPRGALVHLIMSAPTLGDSLRYVERFSRILIDALSVRLVTRGGSAHLVLAFDDERLAAHRHLTDYCLLATVSVLRGAMGDALHLAAVLRRRAWTAYDGDQHARLFQCPVLFDEDEDCLVFDVAALDRAPRVANPLVAEQMEKLASALAAKLEPPASLPARVEAAVRADIAQGRRADRTAIAARLAMSEATLSRRLAEQGCSFKQLRDDVLWEIVEVLLANPALKLEVIALSVGFNDAAAFSKALKRRTGLTPLELRRSLERR